MYSRPTLDGWRDAPKYMKVTSEYIRIKLIRIKTVYLKYISSILYHEPEISPASAKFTIFTVNNKK